MKKKLLFISAILLPIIASCSFSEDSIKSISITPSQVSVAINETEALGVTLTPKDTKDTSYTWTISNPDVLKIENDVITGLSIGEAVIYAKSTKNPNVISNFVKVNVIQGGAQRVNVSDIKLSEEAISIKKGKTERLTAMVYPSNATNKNIVWVSNNENVATVNNGIVSALNKGTAIIYAKSQENFFISSSCVVNVYDSDTVIPVKSISLDQNKVTIDVNKTFTLNAIVSPSNATNQTVIWSSSNTNVATVNNGEIRGIAQGNTTITAKSGDNSDLFATCNVEVVNGAGNNPSKRSLTYTMKDYAKNSCYEISSVPTSGNVKVLVVPLWFTDSTNFINLDKKESVRSDIETAFFGSSIDSGYNSVKTFYEFESNNKLILDGVVTPWYEVGSSYKTYTTDTNKVISLITKISNWYKNQNSTKMTDFDSNNDGYIDAICLIYGAPDYVSLRKYDYSNLWAYTYWVQDSRLKNTLNPGPSCYMWASYDFMYGNNAYSKTGKNYGYGDTSKMNIDTLTYIHEFGHMFGLDDYYDYSDYSYNPAGSISMQDNNVASHDPFSILLNGWADPIIPADSCTIEIGDFQTTRDLVLLSPNCLLSNSAFDEYILLELYAPTGLNTFFNKNLYKYDRILSSNPGIRIWHIDSRLVGFESMSSYSLTTNPTIFPYGTYYAFSNTYFDDFSNDYLSFYGSLLHDDGHYVDERYFDYNLLQVIKNDFNTTYKSYSNFGDSDLFKKGDSFNLNMYSSQFVNGNKLNTGSDLGWSLKINNIYYEECYKASLTITKS